MTELKVRRAGMLTSVQDLGRWGFQSSGVPVAGGDGPSALRLGNAMLGNPEGAAALEVTLLGPELEVCGCGAAVFAGGGPRLLSQRAASRLVARRRTEGRRRDFLHRAEERLPRQSLLRGRRRCAARDEQPLDIHAGKNRRLRGTRAEKRRHRKKSARPSPLWKQLDGFTLRPSSTPRFRPTRRCR